MPKWDASIAVACAEPSPQQEAKFRDKLGAETSYDPQSYLFRVDFPLQAEHLADATVFVRMWTQGLMSEAKLSGRLTAMHVNETWMRRGIPKEADAGA